MGAVAASNRSASSPPSTSGHRPRATVCPITHHMRKVLIARIDRFWYLTGVETNWEFFPSLRVFPRISEVGRKQNSPVLGRTHLAVEVVMASHHAAHRTRNPLNGTRGSCMPSVSRAEGPDARLSAPSRPGPCLQGGSPHSPPSRAGGTLLDLSCSLSKSETSPHMSMGLSLLQPHLCGLEG